MRASAALEDEVRRKFGSQYADDHMAVLPSGQLLTRLRDRIAEARLVREGDIARFHVKGSGATTLVLRGGRWYLSTAQVFAGDGALAGQVAQLFKVFAAQLQSAKQHVDAAVDAAAFAAKMQVLGRETKSKSAALLVSITEELRGRGLLRR